MIAVSFGSFVDFLAAGGASKATKVQRAKRNAAGDGFDYWLALKAGIVSIHRDDRPVASLVEIARTINPPRIENYKACIDGYRRWVKRKRPVPYRDGGKALWRTGDLTVRVNPELELLSGDGQCAIKLYFGSARLTKPRLDLMHHVIRKVVAPGLRPAVLDVRRSTLHASHVHSSPVIDALLEGEARLFVSMWEAA